MKRITQKRLKQLIMYDPLTGIIRARVQRSNLLAGDILGCRAVRNGGTYLRLCIDGRYYYAHQLAWLYVHGKFVSLVDHEDHNGLNNRIANLRKTTHSHNHANAPLRVDNKTGFKGASLTRTGRYRATIVKNQRQLFLGTFDTAEEAHAAYISMARKLFGDFAHAG